MSVDILKQSLSVFKPDAGSANVCSFGYILPGHGLKGKHVWVTASEDLDEMYAVHKTKREITLWCYTNKDGEKPRKSLQTMMMQPQLRRRILAKLPYRLYKKLLMN